MLNVGTKLCVKGSWDPVIPPDGRLAIRLNPLGGVFGNGYHCTTRAFLEDLETLVSPGSTVIDVGTGSAILAIGAALLGAQKVYATDLNPDALRRAQENVDTNGVNSVVEVVDKPLPIVNSGSVDLVLCNSDAPDLLMLDTRASPLLLEISTALKPGGLLVIMPGEGTLDSIRKALGDLSLEEIRSQAVRNWTYIVYGKKQ